MSAVDPRQARLEKARARADRARMRFATALGSTRRRLAPERLKADARLAASDKVQAIKADLASTIRRHPFATASAAAGFVAVLFWKPARIAALYSMRGAQLFWLNRRLWRSTDVD